MKRSLERTGFAQFSHSRGALGFLRHPKSGAKSLSVPVFPLRAHCARLTYRRTLLAGAPRIDLQGQPVGAVTEEAAAVAVAGIERDRAIAAQAASEREARRTLALERQAQIQAAAAARRAKKAAKAPKQKGKKKKVQAKPAAVPAPKAAAAPKSAATVVVVKKRRVIPRGE
ncbi:ProQ/FINO family protein [uncultured Thiodictyon sp.]|uniref:ProQ/FINO family protein n=1 Tax=uncultured Thiodictyon sp. TaxID=1846217 RepID=UPI0025F5BF12|nr:ProQ/FINO family protein [uncultured Thiodictyon sp.]